MARDILRTRIEAIQSGWRRTLLWTEVWTGVLLLTGLVVATGLVDLLLPLPAVWRIALWYLGPLLAVAGLVYLIATRKQRRIDSTRAALLAEKRYPHLQDRFVSAVEYSQREAPSTPVGAHLVDQLLSEARTDARKLNFSGVVPGGRLYRRIAAATLTVGSLWVLGAAFPETVGAQLIRVLQPWRPVPPVLATRIDVEPGDVTLRRGSDQVLRALLSGPPVAEATLHVHRGDGGWQSRPMEVAGADTFAYELYAVDGDLGYFVTAEDARSDTFHIQVYEPPELRQVTVRYTFPSYTGRPVEVRHAGHVRAVRGTQVELTAHYSKDLREAFLAMATEDTLAAEIDGALARYAFSLTDSTTYGLLARDRQGHADETPRQFPIDAVPDAAPLVRFADPGGDVWAIPSDVVPVSLAATDDFGLSDLLFHYSIVGGDEQSLRMGDFAAPGATRSDGDHTFDLRLLGATTGSVITYYAEAGDYHAPEAQRTLSDLQLISVKPYQERLSGFGGQCQGACQLLSSLQAALLHDTWQLLQSPRPGGRLKAAADSLSEEQEALRQNLSRFLNAAGLSRDEDGLSAGAYMDQAVEDLDATAPRLATADQQGALSALMRLEAKLPQALGSGSGGGSGGGGDGDGDASVASRAELEEVLEDFAEQEQQRRNAVFRRARDLLARARQELAVQVALNGTWTAQIQGTSTSDLAPTLRQQQETAEATALLADGIADLETGLDTGRTASLAAAAAAEHMFEATGLGGEGRPQAAKARGMKAQIQLERAVDALYLIVARHAGEVLPLLAGALDQLGHRQESMAGESETALSRPPPWPLTAMRDRQRVITASARDLRLRLGDAAEEVGILSEELSQAAQEATQALLDSSIEERLETLEAAFGDERRARGAIPRQRRAGRTLRTIAANLVAAISAETGSEAAQVAAALNATHALKARLQGGGEGDRDRPALDQLRRLYEPLDDSDLRAGLARLRAAGLGSGGDLGPARAEVLETLDQLESLLEARMQHLARQGDGLPFAGDAYPPEYRELVQRYFRVLAEAGVVQ